MINGWVHGRCTKIKKVSSTLANGFVREECVEAIKRIGESDEEVSFDDQVELVKNLRHFGDSLNASNGSEAAVTTRTMIGWIKL